MYALEETLYLVAPELRVFFYFSPSCKWLTDNDSSTVQGNIQNGTWEQMAPAKWVHIPQPLAWDLTVLQPQNRTF